MDPDYDALEHRLAALSQGKNMVQHPEHSIMSVDEHIEKRLARLKKV